MKQARPDFDLAKFVAAVERDGVEKTLVGMARDLAILTWKLQARKHDEPANEPCNEGAGDAEGARRRKRGN